MRSIVFMIYILSANLHSEKNTALPTITRKCWSSQTYHVAMAACLPLSFITLQESSAHFQNETQRKQSDLSQEFKRGPEVWNGNAKKLEHSTAGWEALMGYHGRLALGALSHW